MLKASHSLSRSRVSALSLRLYWHRVGVLVLAVLAGGMLVAEQVQPRLLAPVRGRIVDGFTPVLDVMTRPVEAVRDLGAAWSDWIGLHDEVVRLRTENARLRAWERDGAMLVAENRALRGLTNFHAEPAATSLAARVIANAGGPFAAGLIVTAGKHDGVQAGMAAVTADGLIGRVTEVNDWSARILLLTDVNARVPVMVEDSGARGILAGADRSDLQVLYLPPDSGVKPGARLVTSGHGGLFPPYLPVAVVTGVDIDGVTAAPIADSGRVNYVRLIDFNLAGGAANGLARTLRPAKP